MIPSSLENFELGSDWKLLKPERATEAVLLWTTIDVNIIRF
jgi:hypothetical protein